MPKESNKKSNIKWVFTIVIWTFVLSIVFSFISSIVMGYVSLWIAFIVLITIIFMGIIFDTIGIAVAVATEVPFHSMASQKKKGAKQSIWLIKNADKVSNFCNDVIGDIAGIISGATSATIVARLVAMYGLKDAVIVSLVLTGLVASLTVGGKAVGKSIALNNSKKIIYRVGLLVYYFDRIRKKD